MSLSPEVVQGLKCEWLSELPSGWRFSRFGEVLEIKRRPIEIEDRVEYVQPIIRRGHGGVEIRERQLGALIKTKAQFVVHAGDWLMSKVQILHRAYGVVPPELDKAIASGSYYAFEIQKDLDPAYLWYLSHSNVFHKSCELASVGVVIEKMVFRATDWLEFEFPLPPLHEQRRVAEILSSVDEAIAATRAVIEQTRKVKQGVLERLLTKGIGHTRYKQTEIGEIPEGWDVATLEQLLANTANPMRSGPFGSALKSEELVESGVPFLGIDNIRVEKFVSTYKRFLSQETFQQLRRFAVNPYDVVITIMGTVGRCCVIPPAIGDAISSKHIWAMSLNQERYLPELACWQMNYAPWIVTKFTSSAQGGIMSAINSSILRKLVLPVPSLSEQYQILDIWRSFQREIGVEQAKLQTLEATKSALMSDLLTGRKRVADALLMAAE